MVDKESTPHFKGGIAYESLRRKGMSKKRAARIANTPHREKAN